MPRFLALVQRLATDPQVKACGPKGQQEWICSTVYRISHNKDAAEIADALARPIAIAFIIVLAWVATRLARRVINRVALHVGDHTPESLFRQEEEPLPLSEVQRLRRAQRVATIAAVLSNVTSIVIWTIAVLVVLSDLGVDLAPFIAGAGVLTVVIGFGAQTIVRDYLSGLLMVLEDQFGVGDVIDVGDITGTVQGINLRTTRLRDTDGVIWYVPNGEIKRVGNKTQHRRVAAASPPVSKPPDGG
jgi:moderate conductance mechanosensitive channel